VAYFTDGKAVKGDPAIAFEWDEGRYHFASQKNRDLFAAEPDRYAPRFGGYCTGSMAGGKEQPNEGDGRAWKIVDGKLYRMKPGDMLWIPPETAHLVLPKHGSFQYIGMNADTKSPP